MSQPTVNRHLKRVKAILGVPSDATNELPSPTSSGTPEKARRMFGILLKNPWDDYSYIRHLDQAILAWCKASYFQLADIREVPGFNITILPHVEHPNIATIYKIYCYDDKIFLVTEHLDVSFAQLDFHKYKLGEREIATIITEVPDPNTNKAIAYNARS
jgi:hypothetical protein